MSERTSERVSEDLRGGDDHLLGGDGLGPGAVLSPPQPPLHRRVAGAGLGPPGVRAPLQLLQAGPSEHTEEHDGPTTERENKRSLGASATRQCGAVQRAMVGVSGFACVVIEGGGEGGV